MGIDTLFLIIPLIFCTGPFKKSWRKSSDSFTGWSQRCSLFHTWFGQTVVNEQTFFHLFFSLVSSLRDTPIHPFFFSTSTWTSWAFTSTTKFANIVNVYTRLFHQVLQTSLLVSDRRNGWLQLQCGHWASPSCWIHQFYPRVQD